METIFLGSQSAKLKAIKIIEDCEINGAYKVVISDTKDKSVQCRGLQWMWNTEVADSGMGSYDTKEDVHRAAKWKWAVPILLRDDENFNYIWPELLKLYRKDQEKIKYIADTFVSTEGRDFQIGEYLTDFERYYRGHGIDLTIPDKGLLEYRQSLEK